MQREEHKTLSAAYSQAQPTRTEKLVSEPTALSTSPQRQFTDRPLRTEPGPPEHTGARSYSLRVSYGHECFILPSSHAHTHTTREYDGAVNFPTMILCAAHEITPRGHDCTLPARRKSMVQLTSQHRNSTAPPYLDNSTAARCFWWRDPVALTHEWRAAQCHIIWRISCRSQKALRCSAVRLESVGTRDGNIDRRCDRIDRANH